jgi:hypothetical protein
MSSPLLIEMLADVHQEEILAQAARDHLAAHAARPSGHSFRSTLAHALRALAIRLDGVERTERAEPAGAPLSS